MVRNIYVLSRAGILQALRQVPVSVSQMEPAGTVIPHGYIDGYLPSSGTTQPPAMKLGARGIRHEEYDYLFKVVMIGDCVCPASCAC